MTLELRNVSLMRNGRAVMRDISFALNPGRVTAILGPNGAGKSTLLRLLAGEIAPDCGQICLDGADLGRFGALALARRRAVMPQAAAMTFPFSAGDVVAMGQAPFRQVTDRALRAEWIERALERADIAHLRHRPYPALSGGERQRVHLARALVQISGAIFLARSRNRPEETQPTGRAVAGNNGMPVPAGGHSCFLMLDEPTAGLDIAHQNSLLAVARDQARQHNIGVLVILHDFNQALACADQVAVLADGQLVADGLPDDVLRPDLLGRVFGWPVHEIPDPVLGRVLIPAPVSVPVSAPVPASMQGSVSAP